MDNALALRAAVESDVPLIFCFIRELAEYERLLAGFEATEQRLHAALFGVNPAAECALAFLGDSPAGFALFFPTFSTFLARPGIHLEDLYVRPEFRRRGVGQALLRHVAQLANDRRCGRLEWTVIDWNEPAIRFYESLGAQILPDWRVCRLTGEALARSTRSGGSDARPPAQPLRDPPSASTRPAGVTSAPAPAPRQSSR